MAAAGAAARAGDEAAGAGKGSPGQVPAAGGAGLLGSAGPERRCGARRGAGGSAGSALWGRRRPLLSGCGRLGRPAAAAPTAPAAPAAAAAGRSLGAPLETAGAARAEGAARTPLPARSSASGSGQRGAAVHRAGGSRSLVEPLQARI